MSYLVFISGQANPRKFNSYSSADNYRHVICLSGVFAWIV